MFSGGGCSVLRTTAQRSCYAARLLLVMSPAGPTTVEAAVVTDSDATSSGQKGGSSSDGVRQIHQPYRPDIDGLRCVCVLMVLAYHLSNGTFLAGGFTGVDVFFVISGYVVTGSLLHDQDGQRTLGELLLRFYARRCKRLTPTLVTVVIIAAVVYSMVLDVDQVLLAHEYFVTGMFGLVGGANVYLSAKEVDYFDDGDGALGNPFLHLWSLGVEEQFYLLWPLGLYVLGRLAGTTRVAARWPALAVTLAVAVAVSAGLEFGLRWERILLFYSFPTRAWQLLAGALTYFLTAALSAGQTAQALLGRMQPLLQLLSTALLAASALVDLPGSAGELVRGTLPVAAGVCFIVAGAPVLSSPERGGESGSWKAKLCRFASLNALLGLSVPRYLGRISYPLYLWHWPVIVIWKAHFGTPSTEPLPLWPHGLLVFICSALLASATFHTVEAGARAWRTGQSLVVIAAAFAGIALAEGVLVLLDGPLGPRLFLGARSNVDDLLSLPVLPEVCKLGERHSTSWLGELPESFKDASGRCADSQYLGNGLRGGKGMQECVFCGSSFCVDSGRENIDPHNATAAQLDTIASCLARQPEGAPDRPRVMLIGDSHSNAMVFGVYRAACANYDFGHFGCIDCDWTATTNLLVKVLGTIVRKYDMVVFATRIFDYPNSLSCLQHPALDNFASFPSSSVVPRRIRMKRLEDVPCEADTVAQLRLLASVARDKHASLVFLGDNADFWPNPAAVCDALSPSDARFPTTCCKPRSETASLMEPWDDRMQELVDEYPTHFYHFSYWQRFCGGDPNFDTDPRCGADQCSPFVPGLGIRVQDAQHLNLLGSVYVGRQLQEFLGACRLVLVAEASAALSAASSRSPTRPAVNASHLAEAVHHTRHAAGIEKRASHFRESQEKASATLLPGLRPY